MKLDHKSLALLVLLVGALVVGSYILGQSHSQSHSGSGPGAEKAAAQARNERGADPVRSVRSDAQAQAPRRDGPGPLPEGAQVPRDHPPLDADNPASTASAGPLSRDTLPFTHFRVGNRNVKGLLVDGDIAWIGTSGGMIRYDISSESHRIFDNQVDGILSNGIFHVSKLGDKIAAGTYGGGLSLFDPASGEWKNYNIPDGLADQFVYDIMQSSDGDVWIATWSGVNRIRGGHLDDPDQWDTFTMENTNGGLPNPWVYGLGEGVDGTMWFATEEGLARYKDGEWENWQHPDGLGAPLAEVRDAIQFTSDPSGYSDHHAQQSHQQGMESPGVAYNPNYVISIKVDSDGVVWAGTWGGGLARFDGEKWRNFTTADGLPGNHIFMLHIDDDDRLWAGTSHGLARLDGDGETFSVMTTADGLFADNVFSMSFADDGSLWAGGFGGVARISRVH